MVVYEPLPPSPQYRSSDEFDPRGMEHVYLIVNTFLDLIVRQDVLPESKFNEFDYLELRIFLQLYNIFS